MFTITFLLALVSSAPAYDVAPAPYATGAAPAATTTTQAPVASTPAAYATEAAPVVTSPPCTKSATQAAPAATTTPCTETTTQAPISGYVTEDAPSPATTQPQATGGVYSSAESSGLSLVAGLVMVLAL